MYDMSIEFSDYGIDLENDIFSVSGFELYEKNGNDYSSVRTGEMGGIAEVFVELGTKKTIVARVYVLNSKGEKVYSDYSNEIVLDHTVLEAPVLTDALGGFHEHRINIVVEGLYAYEEIIRDVAGVEICEKVNGEYIPVEVDNFGATVEVINETKVYVARVYKLDKNQNRVYSEWSNELELSHKIETPTLREPQSQCGDGPECEGKPAYYYNDGVFMYDMSIEFSDYGIDLENGIFSVSGFELYEKNGNDYSSVRTGEMGGIAEVFVELGAKKTIVARVYVLNSKGEKVYSDYSNEIVLDHTMLEAPVLTDALGSFHERHINIVVEGLYTYEEIRRDVAGVEICEKVNGEYIPVEVDNFGATVEVINETKIYVARVYKLDKNQNRVYSEWSNELEISYTIETPTLSAPAGSPEMAFLTVTYEGNHAGEASNMDGWELYEKVDNKYVLAGEKSGRSSIEVNIDFGETKIYVARVYVLNSKGEKVYSGYSNEI